VKITDKSTRWNYRVVRISRSVGDGDGGIKPIARGVAPTIQISPDESIVAAVAIDAAD
jgi:hypothetical protein